jgi:hypothetical protein
MHTKQQIVEAVKTNKCKNLDNLPIESLSKEELVKHLKTVECPCLKKLLKQKTKQNQTNLETSS